MGFEVAWRNAKGDPYVTQTQSILEVRVFLSLSFADCETSNKLTEDWERFKLANKKDKYQECWASVDVKTTLGTASQFEANCKLTQVDSTRQSGSFVRTTPSNRFGV